MAFKLFDWIKDTTTTAGTADFELAGAFATFRSFDDVLGDGDTTHYTAYIDGHRESGLGTYDATAGVLVRTAVFDSTNGGAKVSFPAGTKIIECAPVATRILTLDGPEKSSFLANKNGVNQTIPDADTIVTFGTEVIDKGGVYDPVTSRFTPLDGKTYAVYVQHLVNITSGNRRVECRLIKNGSTIVARGSSHNEDNRWSQPNVSFMVVGNGTDYYQIQINSLTSGGSYAVDGGTDKSYFMAYEI